MWPAAEHCPKACSYLPLVGLMGAGTYGSGGSSGWVLPVFYIVQSVRRQWSVIRTRQVLGRQGAMCTLVELASLGTSDR